MGIEGESIVIQSKTTTPSNFGIFANNALQNDIYEWNRDHRGHHKFSETDADPHNSKRGFFFSHVGWLLCKKHPDVISKGTTIDLSDLSFDCRKDSIDHFYSSFGLHGLLLYLISCGQKVNGTRSSFVMFRYYLTVCYF
jgi:fatty-acid desaturase